MATYDSRQAQNWRLYFRTLAPSTASLAGSLLCTVVVIGFHLLLLSREADLFLPHFTGVANDQLAQLYASDFLRPVDKAFDNNALSTLTTALVWGTVGWALYAILDFAISMATELRRSDQEIIVPSQNRVVQHPLHRQIVIRLLWRFLMGMVLIIFTFSLQPVIAFLFRQDILLLRTMSAIEMLRFGVISLIGWMVIFHIYVVFFRLFVMRTRVLGEIVY